MRFVPSVVLDDHFRSCVHELMSHLDDPRLLVEPGWGAVADQLDHQLDLTADIAPDRTGRLVVGSPAFVLTYARGAKHSFGFVTPDARLPIRTRPWSRSAAWRDDTTLRLWRLGWTLLTVDRLRVTDADRAQIEFLLGTVRATPPEAQAAVLAGDTANR